ncbi:hypothetical protein ACFL9T_06275 [Thermodesulfobacteriota bacterium]
MNDIDGQRKVLMEALSVFEKAQKPGQIFNLPFIWPEEPKNAKWHPQKISPLVQLQLKEIKEAGRK